MKIVLYIILCLYAWTTKAETVWLTEEGSLSMDENLEGKNVALNDAIPIDRTVYAEAFDRQEDEWEEDPPLFGQVCQISHGQGCQEPETNQRHLELDTPGPRAFHPGESDDESKSITEDLSPVQDTITSSDSMDVLIPSDNMKLQTKKSVNVNFSKGPLSDIQTTTLYHPPAATEAPKDRTRPQTPPQNPYQRSYNLEPDYSLNFIPTRSNQQQPGFLPDQTQFQYNAWQYPPPSASKPRVTPRKNKQRTQPEPRAAVTPKPSPVKLRKVLVLPSESPRKKIKARRKGEKRAANPCQRSAPKPRPSKPKKRLLCEEVETRKRSVKAKPCKRRVRKRKPKAKVRMVASRQQPQPQQPQKCPCNDCPSVERTPKRKEKKMTQTENVGVCYLATRTI